MAIPNYNNPGQINDEALNIAGGRTFQVMQLADADGNVINPASGNIVLEGDVTLGAEVEIGNDIGNPIPTIGGFALPPYDEFVMNNDTAPTEVVYKKDDVVVATVTLTYGVGGNVISGLITYPSEA